MKKKIKSTIKKVVSQLGYRLESNQMSGLIDLREERFHPASIHYLTNFTPVLMDVDVSLGRGLRVFSLSDGHPFVYVLKRAMTSQRRMESITDLLAKYYGNVIPTSASDWLDLPATPNTRLHNVPPIGLSMPWDRRTPEEWMAAREAFSLHENSLFGENLSIKDGWHFWGAISERKLVVESRRLDQLTSSILERGLLRHNGPDGDICAVVLRRGTEWCWQVAGGEHRAAVLCALGYSTIPVRVLQVVQREDVGAWPGVLNGTFDQASATAAFDLIFSGVGPKIAKGWAT